MKGKRNVLGLLCSLILGCGLVACGNNSSSVDSSIKESTVSETSSLISSVMESTSEESSLEASSVEPEPSSFKLLGRYVSDDTLTVVNAQLYLNEDLSLELKCHDTFKGTWSRDEKLTISMTIEGVSYSMEKVNGFYSFVFNMNLGEVPIAVTLSNQYSQDESNENLISAFAPTVNKLRTTYQGRTGGVIFYGGSNFVKWTTLEEDLSEYDVMNKSFGGSNDFLRQYYANDLIYNSDPEVIVYMTSSNDWTSGATKEEIEEFKFAFFDEMKTKLPDCVFVICSQTPNPLRYFGEYHDGMVYIDEKTEEYCKNNDHFEYYSVLDLLTDENCQANDDIWQSDKLHLNEDGYQILAEDMNKELASIAQSYNIDISKKEN